MNSMFAAHGLGIIEIHLLSKRRKLRVEVTFKGSLRNLFILSLGPRWSHGNTDI